MLSILSELFRMFSQKHVPFRAGDRIDKNNVIVNHFRLLASLKVVQILKTLACIIVLWDFKNLFEVIDLFFFCACGLRNETFSKVKGFWKFDTKYNLICPYLDMNKWMGKLSPEILRNFVKIYVFHELVIVSANFLRLLRFELAL